MDDDYLLAGLLAEGESAAARMLAARGVTLDQVRAGLPHGDIDVVEAARPASVAIGPVTRASRLAGVRDEATTAQDSQAEISDDGGAGHVPFTATAHQVIERAHEASVARNESVSAEQLLLALVEIDGKATRLLDANGIDHEGLRSDLLALLGHSDGGEHP
jgi:Clp amino terminal domain, pathogenicity island component